MTIAIVAIAGMPGSGKSGLIEEHVKNGFEKIDDFNRDWAGNLRKAMASIQKGNNIIVSDIEFCRHDMRERFQRDIVEQVQWIFFANNPYQCAKNVLYRQFIENRPRPWAEEIQKIERLSKVYFPLGDVRPVIITPP